MPENALDILRLKAKAKAKAVRERGGESSQQETPPPIVPQHPFGWKPDVETPAILENKSLGTGIEQAQRGNIVGGAGNIAAGIVQGAMSPLATADQTLRQIPYVGKLASNLINSPTNLLGDIKRDIIHPMVQGLGLDENMGMKPETAQGLSNAVSTLAPIALAKPTTQIANKIGTSIAQGMSRLANRLEQPAIGVPTEKNASVFENRKLADFNLNRARYGVGSNEHIRLNKDIGKVQGGIDSKLAEAKYGEKTVDINPVIETTRKELSSPKYIGQRNVLAKVLEEVDQNFADALKDYPDGKLPPDVAYNLKRNIADLASNAFDNPNASMLRRTYKSVTGKLLDAIESQVPGIRKAGLYEEKLMDLERGIGKKQKSGEAKAPGGNMASWKIPVISNPTILHGAAKALNTLGGGYFNPKLMGSVPASTDLSRVSMPRGQGGYYEEPPIYNGEQKFGNQSLPPPSLYSKVDMVRAQNRPKYQEPMPQPNSPSLYSKVDVAKATGKPFIPEFPDQPSAIKFARANPNAVPLMEQKWQQLDVMANRALAEKNWSEVQRLGNLKDNIRNGIMYAKELHPSEIGFKPK